MKFGFRRPRAIDPEVQLPESNPDSHGHPQNCLSCGAALVGPYCHQCSQSAHTHRMSFKHFLLHDFIHGVWHLDKGFPATIKKAFVNPGTEIRTYLAGKRTGWFSILTMILILYALVHYFTPDHEYTYTNKESEVISEFINHNSKWLLLALAFVCSWSSYLVFRRPRLNLSEHTVINSFFLVGILVINLLYTLIPSSADVWDYIAISLTVAYLIYGYYGAFRRHYSLAGWMWRIAVHGISSLLFLLFVIVLGVSTFLALNGKKNIYLGIDAKLPDTTTNHAPRSH